MEREGNILRRIINALISSVIGLVWVIIISRPQVNSWKESIWVFVYFLPFFLFATLIGTFLFSRVTILTFVERFFLSKKAVYIVTAVLLSVVVASWNKFFKEITLLSFITNVSAFSFSMIVYYRLVKRH